MRHAEAAQHAALRLVRRRLGPRRVDPDPARRAAPATAAHRGMRDACIPADLQHRESHGHDHAPAVRIGHADQTAPTLPHAAHATRDQHRAEQRRVADEPALADPHEGCRLRRRERRAPVPEHLRPHGRIAGERGGLASAVDEAENGQHRHQHHDAQQPGRRARIPRAQLDDRVQADHRVHPREAHDQHLPAAEVGRERPQRQRHAGIRVLDTVDLPRDPRADDVGDEQRWDRQPERQLRGLPERHAQRAALVERPEREHHVRDQRAVEQQREERIAPQREEVDAAGLHRVEGDEAQRMIRQVRRHIREQYEAGPEPDAPCRGHDKDPGGLYPNGRTTRRQDRDRDGRWGGLDILHNNVGIESRQTLMDTTEHEWDRVMAVSLKSMLLATQAAVPALERRGGGAITCVSSVAAGSH